MNELLGLICDCVVVQVEVQPQTEVSAPAYEVFRHVEPTIDSMEFGYAIDAGVMLAKELHKFDWPASNVLNHI